jgi:hypothetical protein
MRRASRLSAAPLLAGLLTTSAMLSGCTVEIDGVAAVGVDAQGDLIGYIQMCGHHVDGATFYDTGGFNGKTKGSWSSVAPVTDFAKWSLADPTDGCTATERFVPPTDGHEYALYGWTTDNSWSARQVTFRPSDIAGLRPGDVLYSRGDKLVRTTEDGFRHEACVE